MHIITRIVNIRKAALLILLLSAPVFSFAQAQLFGLTSSGGSDGIGTLFRYDPATGGHVLKQSMRNLAPGIFSGYIELTDGGNGKFYGMTINGGAHDEGVIFEWDPVTNVYTKKIDFNSANNGGFSPMGNLTLYNGKYYGMTPYGGANGIGTIFEWDPVTNIYQKRLDLDMINGCMPFGSFVVYGSKLYALTSLGGGNFAGTIIEWDPVTNVLTPQLDFSNTNGRRPYGTLVWQGNKYYGTTKEGGANGDGTIFEWDPVTGIFQKRYDMSWANGNSSFGALTYQGSKFYGTTDSGGVNNKGVIFEWDPITNVYTKKIDLSPASGANGHGRMAIGGGGKMYGMTARGGASNRGVIFEWNPLTNAYVKKQDLVPANGCSPFGSMYLKGGKFYGITCTGGTPDKGVIFEWDPATNAYVKKVELNYSIGSGPYGSLVLRGGYMYGMTVNGGSNDKGTIFEYDTLSNVLTKKIDMNVAQGCNPYGSLVEVNNKFYGMTSKGGANNLGVIFEWDPMSNVYTKKVDLSSANGCEPWGSLTLVGNKLYGMMQNGGATNEGVIFEWDPQTNVYTKKIDLTAANGRNPFGSLTAYNGKLYGLATFGGAYNKGTLFEWDPVSNVYTKKVDMVDSLGSNPFGSLLQSNGMFYGMTYQGGVNLAGVIFDWNPVNNVYRDRMDFNVFAGKNPYGSLVLVGGKCYGMTTRGGNSNEGTVFEWDTLSNVYSMMVSLSSAIGSIPYGDLLIRPCILLSQPGAISGPSNICELTTNTYSIAPVPGALSYTWTLPNGWSGSSVTNSISATAAFTGGTITVKANDGCGSSPVQTLAVTVNQTPQTPGPINGPQTICRGVLTTYSVTPVAGANSYIWTIPGGWTGSSVTNTINVTPGPNSGIVSVRANNNACGASPAINLYVTVNNIPATPFSLAGPSQVCAGNGYAYSVGQVAGATSYTWTLPNGWTGSSVTNSISVVASANSGNVTVTANSACGSSQPKVLAVTVYPTYNTSNSISICQGDSIYLAGAYQTTAGVYNSQFLTTHGCDSNVVTTLSINPLPNVTFNTAVKGVCIDDAPFTLIGGLPFGGVYSGPGVSNGMFDPAAAGVGMKPVTYTYTDPNTGCSNSVTRIINVNPLPPPPLISSHVDTLMSSTTYGNQWYLNGVAISGATAQTYIALANGDYTVCFTDSNGCQSCSSILTYTMAGIRATETGSETLHLFPNPVSDVLTLVRTGREEAVILMYNTLGDLVYSAPFTDSRASIDVRQLPSGVYMLQLRSAGGVSAGRIVKE